MLITRIRFLINRDRIFGNSSQHKILRKSEKKKVKKNNKKYLNSTDQEHVL